MSEKAVILVYTDITVEWKITSCRMPYLFWIWGTNLTMNGDLWIIWSGVEYVLVSETDDFEKWRNYWTEKISVEKRMPPKNILFIKSVGWDLFKAKRQFHVNLIFAEHSTELGLFKSNIIKIPPTKYTCWEQNKDEK